MIETERLLIRPYIIEDAAILFNNLHTNKEHLEDYFSLLFKTIKNIEDTEQYLLSKQKDSEERKAFICGIFLKDTLTLIGSISVREIDWRVPKGELAYFIFKEFRDWCFTEHKFCRLFLKIAPDNFASINTAINCDFQFEGLLKKDYRKKEQKLIDMNIYGYTGLLY
jgi:RimJ/RimL family protein N-acetyltransferase